MIILDLVIVVILLIGAYRGWKLGMFRSLISLIGTIAIVIIAYLIKNPLSSFLYINMPFLNFHGLFKGITSINILVYETISYIICFLILYTILKIIIKLTGIIDKLINVTVIFMLPSKILGSIFKVIEYYIFIFVVTLIIASIPMTTKYYNSSKIGNIILSKTPFISSVTDKLYNSSKSIYDVVSKPDNENKDYDSLDILLEYDIITVDSVKVLKDKKKITIDNIDTLIEKYEVKEND